MLQAGAQQYFFKNYSVESGLPFVQVSCLYQDHNGYLWSGGYGGLSRFDGVQFVNYNRRNGLIDHNVNAICEDVNGDIFVGTSKGLSILRERKFINFDGVGNIANPSITSFCKGYHNSIYVGSTKGLFMFKNDKLKQVKKLEGYNISCLFNPDTSVIFIGTDKGLVLFGHNTFRLLNRASGLCSDKVTCISKFRNFMVIGTTGGLSLYDLGSGRFINYFIANGLIDENITSLNSQAGQVLWVGSQSGLLRFNGRQFDYYNIDADNNSNQVRCILGDREDNIWLGTHSGLYKYRDNSFSTFDKNSGVGTSFIYQIFRDRRGYLWVCTQNNGIYRGQGNTFKHYNVANGLPSNICRSGIEDRQGRLFFGTPDKLLQFRDEHFYSVPLPGGLKGPYDEMYLGADNTLWIGGSNGFAGLSWENGRLSSVFYPIEAKTDFNIYGFCEDSYRNLYIGTYKAGLYRLLNGRRKLENLSAELKLNEENFLSLRQTKNKVFAASLNGLLVLDIKTNTLKKITEADGLNSELVYSIEFTRDKSALWIGTNQGVNKLNLKWYLGSGLTSISSFGKQEGFTGVECNTNGMWEDTDGTFWFGTVGGLVKHEPFNLKKNKVENTMLIQKVQILNEDTVLRDSSVLSSDMNTISFYYRGICLTNPNKVLYQKKLEGLDKDWSAPSSEDYIKYTNLAPGRYTFMVRSGNNEGIWNSTITRFNFEIKSPFYLTWWFLLIGFICVFALIYVLFMIRIINIKKKQRMDFERKVEMSRIELKALRSQMNPHFVFNSLNSIQHYIFNTRSDEAIKYLNKFARLVRIILNNSDKPSVTVQEDLEALKLYVELEQMRFEDKFDYEIVVDNSVDVDYDIMPPLLMQPYVENAILHGLNPKPEKGKLTITLNSKNNFLICTITDNGIGREKAAEIKRTMPYRKHKSMGMKITEDRLKILNEINNSQLSVTITDLKDADGKALGTRVQLFVPLNG